MLKSWLESRKEVVRLRHGPRRTVLVLVASLWVSLAHAARADPLELVTNLAQILYYEIYDATTFAARVPYELAKPIVIRAGLKHWVQGLPLAEPVRERVVARIESEVLVDEVIPFLLAIKETYVAGEDAVPSFDTWLRGVHSSSDSIPGMEHSMFDWEEDPETADEPAGLSLDADLTAQIVDLYDALYLGSTAADAGLGDELEACERRADRAELRAAVSRSLPIVRGIIEAVRSRLALDEDLDGAVQATLDDPKRLETVTTTAIEFIDHLVCSSYRVFATRLLREQQLERWLLGELEKEHGGELWRYLEFANRERRYGVVTVVDGLQGHLVEALARGVASSPFLHAVLAQRAAAGSVAPRSQRSRPAPKVREHFLESLVDAGYSDPRHLGFFRDLYRDDGPQDERRPYGIARVGISTTPTISVRNLPMAKTGATVAGPGGTGIPNFHFVDREFTRPGDARGRPSGRPYYFFGNDAMRLATLTRAAGMRSLFDRLPTWSSFSCAAQYDDAAHYRIDALLNLALGEAVRDLGEILCMTELRDRARNEQRLRRLRSDLLAEREDLTRELPFWRLLARSTRGGERSLARRKLEQIAALEQRALPELLVWYVPWPDHFAHFKGPFGDEILSPSGELNRLDYWLGRLSEAYREGGVLDRTLFGMSGDHGLTPVFHFLNPEVEVFDALRAEGVDFRMAKISSDEGEGPKLNSLFDPPSMRGYDVVVASTAGGNYMLDFFVDQEARWREQPLYRELTKLRLIPKAGNAPVEVDVIAAIHAKIDESLDYLVVREDACGVAGGEVRIVGSRPGPSGMVRADAWITRIRDRIFYRYEAVDLLGTDRLTRYARITETDRQEHARLRKHCVLGARREEPGTWCKEEQWRQLTSFTNRPDSVVQLAHLYDSDRAGTVNLFPRDGIGYNTLVPGRHAGESFYEKDAFVGVWGVPVGRGPREGRIRTAVNGSVPGAIFEWLTGDPATPGSEGWGFPRLGPELRIGE